MSMSKIMVLPFPKKTVNGIDQVKLQVIAGMPLPATYQIINVKFLATLAMKVGKSYNVACDLIGEEEIVRDGKKTGEYRPKYSFSVLPEDDYLTDYYKEFGATTAKIQAKAALKFQPKFALGGSTKKADASTDTPPVVNPAFMETFTKEFDRISDIADDTADAEWATLRASVKAEAEKPENKAHAVWFSDFKMKVKEETGVEAE